MRRPGWTALRSRAPTDSGRTCPFVSCIEDVDGHDALMFASANWLAQSAVGRQARRSLHPCQGVFDSVALYTRPFRRPGCRRGGLATSPRNFVPGICRLLDTLSTDPVTAVRYTAADTLPRVPIGIDRIRLGCFCIATTRTHPDVQSSIFWRISRISRTRRW